MDNEELVRKIDVLKDKPKEEREEFSPEKEREKLKSARHKADIPLTILAVPGLFHGPCGDGPDGGGSGSGERVPSVL